MQIGNSFRYAKGAADWKKFNMTMKIFFSIIILVYNQEKTIEALLEKLVEICKGYATEIIIVNSESTDNTLSIIEKYRKKLFITIIHIKKSQFNFSATRNFAVKKAKGTYIFFISGDVLPVETRVLKYLLEDFQIRKDVVAVFGKHIPYDDSPFIQKLETICRFQPLDNHTDENGVLIQNIKTPFIPFQDKNKYWWYMLSNSYGCYKKAFLLKYPFPKTNSAEDTMLGKFIIENGFTKIYDAKCFIIHSHRLSLWGYYLKQKQDFGIRISKLNVKKHINIMCKIYTIQKMNVNSAIKIYYYAQLAFFYGIKAIAFIEMYLKTIWKKNIFLSLFL